MVSHTAAHLLLGVKCGTRANVFYCSILNIKKFDIVLKCFHFKMKGNGNNA